MAAVMNSMRWSVTARSGSFGLHPPAAQCRLDGVKPRGVGLGACRTDGLARAGRVLRDCGDWAPVEVPGRHQLGGEQVGDPGQSGAWVADLLATQLMTSGYHDGCPVAAVAQ